MDTINQATPTLTLKSGLAFDFSGATTASDQYVSGLLHGTGLTDYYAKFADTSTSGTGDFSVPATISGDGVYSFDIFSEQANGVNESDFMGRPIQFELTVGSGAVTDLTLLTTDIDFGLDGGTIGLKGGKNYTQAWALGNSGTNTFNTPGDSKISGVLSGLGGLTKTGAGTLTLSGTNTYTGQTVVLAGTLSGNIAAGTDLGVQTGATYDANGANRSVGALTGTGTVAMGGNALTVSIGNFSGTISGNGTSLTKTGTGTLAIFGTNTYSGGTTINSGTVAVSSDANLGASTGNLTVNAGTFRATDSFTTNRTVTLYAVKRFSSMFFSVFAIFRCCFVACLTFGSPIGVR